MEKDRGSSDISKATRLAAAIRARALFRTKSFNKVARLLKLADRVEVKSDSSPSSKTRDTGRASAGDS